MDKKTLIILSKIQRGKISYKKACKLLKKSEKEIDELFDSDDYIFLSTIKDEKKLFELENENIKQLMIKTKIQQQYTISLSKDVGQKKFIVPVYSTNLIKVPNQNLKVYSKYRTPPPIKIVQN